MLAKLLELLIHAKAGAISGVFLLGATGALVSVSATNGVTTITLTDPSPTPTATATTRPTPTPTASPSATASPKLSLSPNSPVAPTACSDEAKALALQTQRVDSAFKGFHTDLVKLHDQRDRATIEKADKTLKLVRQSAVKAIHATETASCRKHDDDEDDNDENDNDEADNDHNNGQHGDKKHENDGKDESTSGITFTGSAESIATQAIAAMQTAFDVAKNATATTAKPAPTHKAEPTHGPKAATGNKDPKGQHRD